MPSHSYDVLVRLAPEVPAAMVERATRWTPDSVPSVAAPAASVILLRDGLLDSRPISCTAMHEWLSPPRWWSFLAVALTQRTLPTSAIPSIAARSVRPSKRQVSFCRDGPPSLGALDHSGNRAPPL